MSNKENDKIDDYMFDHVVDNLKVIRGTVVTYIEISEKLNLDPTFLQDILNKIDDMNLYDRC